MFFKADGSRGSKPLGTRLFETIARLSVSVAFEAVCLRQSRGKGKPEVFLLKRGPHESYAGKWHVPGSVFRSGELPHDVARRLGRREFKTPLKRGFQFIGDFFHAEERGWFFSRAYLVTLKGKPNPRGRWWRTDKLPRQIVPIQRDILIPLAVAAFAKKRA